MALIINNMEEKYFTIEEFNSRIKYFLYSDWDTVIPLIKDAQLKNHCIMYAPETLWLVSNFNFIVGDLVKKNDNVWKYYPLLLEITEILTGQTFTIDLLEYLETLISELHKNYLEMFNEKIKPKHHLLLHYPKIIKKIGPPILTSSFQGESKHREIIKVCHSITSRKQILLSATIRYQLKTCCRFISKKGLINLMGYSKISHQTYVSETEFLLISMKFMALIITKIQSFYIISMTITSQYFT